MKVFHGKSRTSYRNALWISEILQRKVSAFQTARFSSTYKLVEWLSTEEKSPLHHQLNRWRLLPPKPPPKLPGRLFPRWLWDPLDHLFPPWPRPPLPPPPPPPRLNPPELFETPSNNSGSSVNCSSTANLSPFQDS